ncbi:unnamed protein product [Effrenium voratum]|uniref:Transmembrane protein 144 n=1 Tax=Effrenium voratum TaxID=2562239 RepID=A0AA36IYE0_9DINO|nr:unnamed protein product [Effrenium voratum]
MVAFAGFISAAFAVLFFGSNYTVVAKYDAGDGMLFQLVLCLGIWVTGLVVLVMRGSPAFYPVAMCGGVLWGTGNCMSAYIIRRTGLGLGLVTWGSTALIIGWLTGFFGLFGLPSEQRCLDQPWLNVVGFGLAIAALGTSTLIRKTPAQKLPGGKEEPKELEASSWERTKGILASLSAGTCYGFNFLPSTWIQHHVTDSSKEGLDYVLWHYICLHCVELGYSAAFPIMSIGPGVIGSMWSVFVFKDIQGRRNHVLLALYFKLAIASCICIVVSRKASGTCD